MKLEVPVIPRTFYAAGINYAAHIREMAEKRGVKPVFPEKADIGYRANNALIAHDEDVVIPTDATEKINYEGELVVVIGKQAKHLTEADAMSCVFGYTIGNDVSERTWQRGDRTFWRGKNTDTFKPMGPWIDTDVDLDAMETIVRVNGKEDLRFKTNDMIFDIADLHRGDDALPDAVSGRRDLDGHRRHLARPEAWRRGRGGTHRPRRAAQSLRAGELISPTPASHRQGRLHLHGVLQRDP